MFTLDRRVRRLIYVTTFEILAILLSTALLSLMNNGSASASLPLAIAVSVIAVIWNFCYNSGFEALESKLKLKTRTIRTRVLHSLGFEGGLVIFTVPLIMYWYQVGLFQALMMEAALMIFFLVYTFVFTLGFDQIFTLPQAREQA
ncbi:PACE efflux transporter [Paracoccus sp. (in: a-proteobacteria)]|uniref:PACE efflux transporter n=1 Tax=Paracoccus sp. TaxID=267 RepID=UPI00289AA849|nr:PACE efflux transporter [Paracoccus sp. (in: a-proteobacteria)]